MLRTQDKRLNLGLQLSSVFTRGLALHPPATDYIAWYDASKTSTITLVSGVVSQWNDLGPNGYHWSQSTPGLRPGYYTHISGVTCPRFDGSDDKMTSNLPASDRSSSYFLVGNAELGGQRALLGSQSGGFEWRMNGSNNLEVLAEGVLSMAVQNNAAITTGYPFVVAEIMSGTQVTHYYNGTTETDNDSNTFTGGTTHTIGARGSASSDFWCGSIAELVVYSRTLSSDEITSTANYLYSKWHV